ncbi:MAG: beta-ketoacyl-ACP synthase II, partial [Candidatus Izemoplasmataceae bacterium]
MKRRVVITGMGTLNPLGNTVEESWKAAREGRNGIARITRFDPSDLRVQIAGEVKGPETDILSKKEKRRLDRFTQLGILSAHEAMEDADFLDRIEDPYRVGIYYSSGIGGLETIAEQNEKGVSKGYNRISPFFIPMSIINIAAGQLAIKYGLKGPSLSNVTACASATNSIGEAFRAIRDGYIDFAISGGSEASITKLGISGFDVMQALSDSNDPENASKPFDKNRSGFVMGEGAATLILETLGSARARGARIYGEIVGYATTSDAVHITAPDVNGEGAMHAMRLALEDADVAVEDIHHINAHGTSTPLNDKVESIAIRRLFKDHADAISVSSTKSMTGHLLGASGAVESVFTIKATEDNFVPPTIHYETFDEACDLDYTVNEGKNRPVEYALNNSFGFGGHNASLVFKKWRDDD